ncbi:UDP-N-acetylmuramoyl-tripeptide--D-alanyl-D-alanine ligase [Clostridium tarantellae]|uniref:UDP-N-acetylmuramoyl-tripeptide--D-alanyl-D-alanine ligase n=1 Tax=Clostridium tarantellae TaxID=39493 RepID=A0A6I1MTY2_9CLOT|nr:UDP-N-acetylmuramoyl-tripeptide--D-alanyl-D-alanine ligase [Clostridium tarantellae]MPQ43689.1 UDP-N-acetylmuramoyl-tripeptide--D-alanyl-D-alanine ligase [Clostridium tarantellae]
MLELSFNEIAKAVDGEILKEPIEYNVQSVSTDTRKIKENTMFIALKGCNFNGNDYVEEAFNKGANVCIIDEIKYEENNIPSNKGLIKVENGRVALMELAKYYRKKLALKVIGITGSAGKTSTKDLLAALLSDKFKVFKTKGNFNNDIGLPLMILELDSNYDIAVLEMGMNNLKEIEKLAEISSPDMAIITNIGLSHIENLKTRDNILKAKMEITTYFGENNILVVNGNDDKLSDIDSKDYNIIKTGIGEDFNIGAKDFESREFSSKFKVFYNDLEEEFLLNMPGKHNVQNLMLGIAISKELGLTLKEMKNGLKNLKATSMRLELIKNNKFIIVNDCYNSSPSSVKSAIDVVKSINGKRRIGIFGTMKELGAEARNAHNEIGKYAKENKIDLVLCCGEFSENIQNGFGLGCIVFNNKEELIKNLKNVVKNDDIVLVKASRSMKFEEITNSLKEI